MPIPKKSDNHPVAEKHLPEDWPRTRPSERADNTAVKSVMALEHQRYRVLAVTARVWVSLSKQQQQRGSNKESGHRKQAIDNGQETKANSQTPTSSGKQERQGEASDAKQ